MFYVHSSSRIVPGGEMVTSDILKTGICPGSMPFQTDGYSAWVAKS